MKTKEIMYEKHNYYPLIIVKNLSEVKQFFKKNCDLFVFKEMLFARIKDLKKEYYHDEGKIKRIGEEK